MTVRVLVGDALSVLRTLDAGSVQTCVTSPPYWGLRDYNHAEQIGLEGSPEQYVAALVAVFAEVRRVLRPDGTLWLNLGDSYVDGGRGADAAAGSTLLGSRNNQRESRRVNVRHAARGSVLRPKNLLGIPWRVAFALQEDGWFLRSDIIWAKPNGMPESVRDRPTRSHEYVFLLSKSARYYYDQSAVRQPLAPASIARLGQNVDAQEGSTRGNGGTRAERPMKAVKFGGDKGGGSHGFASRTRSGREWEGDGANLRDVWWLSTEPSKLAHFALMPSNLARLCILAGSPAGGLVLDPFGGAGTTGLVADRFGRDAVLVELNPEYAAIAEERIRSEAPLFAAAE